MKDANVANETTGGIWLTPDGHRRLKEELDTLMLVKRPEIADRIRESQQHGEFSEDNNELDEVKFEQAMVENRIAELKSIFGNAHTLDMDQVSTEEVGIGSLITLHDLEYGDEFEVRLVCSIEADPDRDLISNESPLGMAVQGRAQKEEFEFEAPEGKKRYRVVDIAR